MLSEWVGGYAGMRTQMQVLSLKSVLSPVPKPQAPNLTKPQVLPLALDVGRYGQGCAGGQRTWTGKIVSLDAWRQLSEWEKHGPGGRMWNGVTRQWEPPET